MMLGLLLSILLVTILKPKEHCDYLLVPKYPKSKRRKRAYPSTSWLRRWIDFWKQCYIEGGAVAEAPADFTITTTADFDAGVKSQPSPADGNYEIETITDNPANTANQIILANMRGDAFNFDDADGDTWKWNHDNLRPITYYSGSANIASGIYTLSTTRNANRTGYDANLPVTLTGDFDIRINMTRTVFGLNYRYGVFEVWYNSSNYVWVGFFTDSSTYYVRSRIMIAGTYYDASYSTTDTSISVRIVRTGSTISTYYDLTGGDTWTQLDSRTAWTYDVNLLMVVHTGNVSGANVEIQYDNFRCDVASFVANGYRTSGNWESAVQTAPSNKKMKETTITYSNVSATNYISRIEWLVDGAVRAAYETDITSGTSKTITETDLTSGTFMSVHGNWTIKIYLASGGTGSPSVSEISGYYEDCFVITSTSDFDAGVKSQPSPADGNYEIETITDNLKKASDEIALADKYSDRYTLLDSDAITWKWQDGPYTTGSYARDINSTSAGKLYQRATYDTAPGCSSLLLTSTLAGGTDFDCHTRVTIVNWATPTSDSFHAIRARTSDDSYFCVIMLRKNSGFFASPYTGIWARVKTPGGTTDGTFATTDGDVWLRVSRSGNTASCSYKLAETDAWTTLASRTDFDTTLAIESILYSRQGTNAGTTDANYDDFHIEVGTLSSPYRTSGNWRSASLYTATPSKITRIVSNVKALATATIKNDTLDALELYAHSSDDFTAATKLEGWTNAELKTAGMTEDGVDSTIDLSNLDLGAHQYFWLKVFMEGDGAGTPLVYDFSMQYAPVAVRWAQVGPIIISFKKSA